MSELPVWTMFVFADRARAWVDARVVRTKPSLPDKDGADHVKYMRGKKAVLVVIGDGDKLAETTLRELARALTQDDFSVLRIRKGQHCEYSKP